MQLRMEGRSYPGRFVIADIKAEFNLPTERLCFFDPAWTCRKSRSAQAAAAFAKSADNESSLE
jgi:hypothetical protein